MTKPTGDPSPLSSSRVFVLHLGTAAAPADGVLDGRVEHVPTGRTLRFHDLHALLAFLAAVDDPDPAPLVPTRSPCRKPATDRCAGGSDASTPTRRA